MFKIDLHGQIESEARINFQVFLVECEVKKLKYASVSHGYGENILRNMIYEILNNHPFIENYQSAHPNDGGAGITIITFDWKKNEK